MDINDQVRKKIHNIASAAEVRLAKIYSDDQPNPQIQESLFTSTFLMMFAIGGKKVMNVYAWQAVAGTLSNPVDVFRGDEYLFTVPPLVLPPKTRITKRRHVHPINAMNIQTTAVGQLMAANETSPTASMLTVNRITKLDLVEHSLRDQYLTQWDAIFKRYDIDYKTLREEYVLNELNEKRVREGKAPLSELPVKLYHDVSSSSKEEEDTGVSFNGSGNITPY